MTTKLAIRVMDAAGQMLGSCVHHAAIKGDGCLRAAGLVQCGIAQSGSPHTISLHWCDVNVEVRVPAPNGSVQAGQVVTLFEPHAEMVRVGSMPEALPPLVVGSVDVGVPVGGMGAGSR